MNSAMRRGFTSWAARPSGPRGARQLVAAGIAIALVTIAVVGGLLRVGIDTTASAFLPASDPAIVSLDYAARSFGGDPIVILAESAAPHSLLSGDQLPRLIALEGKLAALPNVAVVYGPGTLLNQLANATRNMMATIFGARDAARTAAEERSRAAGDPAATVTAAGDAAVAQYDEHYGPLIVDALPAGLPTVHNAQFVDHVIFDQSGNPRPAWRFLVPEPNAIAILVRPREHLDQTGTDELVRDARTLVGQAGLATSQLTISGTPAVFADLGHNVQREIPLLGIVALVLIISCYTMIPWTRQRRYRIVPVISTVSATIITLAMFGWLGVKLSLGAVAFLPILIGVGSDFPAYVIHGVHRRRVLVTAGASAAGFASLGLSPLPFVRDLGLALAVGVILAAVLALSIRKFFLTSQAVSRDSTAVSVSSAPDVPSATEHSGASAPIRGRSRVHALTALVAVAVLGWVLLPRLEVQAQPEQLAAGLPSVAGAQHVETVMGSSGEVDVLLNGPNVRTPQALSWMRRAENSIVLRYGDSLPPAVTLPDLLRFLGPNPSQDQFNSAMGLLPHYLTAAVINDDGTESFLSLGISLQDLRSQQRLIASLESTLPRPPPGMTVSTVGLPVAAARGYELVSQHRYLANVVGILAAGAVLFLGLARRSDAGRAVLAAALATGWGLAGAWLLHIPLSPLSAALGSLTTATACEFTVLFSFARTGEQRALRRTVYVAATAAALGYLALTASTLAVLVQFGLLLAATVGLSLLAAIAVTRLLPPAPQASTPTTSTPTTSTSDSAHQELVL